MSIKNHNNAVLAVSDVNFDYGNKTALENINFSINPAEFCVLLGLNGAGKSTLYALITGLYQLQQGSITINGNSIDHAPQNALEDIGVVFQQSTLDPDLTVEQNLRYHTALRGINRKVSTSLIETELKRLALWSHRDKRVRELNGGHQRRIEIARALLHSPALLLLDEPTVGLDMHSRQFIVDYVHTCCHEHAIAVLWATHLIDEIADSDAVIVLHQGIIAGAGKQQQLLTQTASNDLSEAFNRLTGYA